MVPDRCLLFPCNVTEVDVMGLGHSSVTDLVIVCELHATLQVLLGEWGGKGEQAPVLPSRSSQGLL